MVAFTASAKMKKKKEEEEHLKYAQVTFHPQKEKQVPIIIVALCSCSNNEKKIRVYTVFFHVFDVLTLCSWSLSLSLSCARACNELRKKKEEESLLRDFLAHLFHIVELLVRLSHPQEESFDQKSHRQCDDTS